MNLDTGVLVSVSRKKKKTSSEDYAHWHGCVRECVLKLLSKSPNLRRKVLYLKLDEVFCWLYFKSNLALYAFPFFSPSLVQIAFQFFCCLLTQIQMACWETLLQVWFIFCAKLLNLTGGRNWCLTLTLRHLHLVLFYLSLSQCLPPSLSLFFHFLSLSLFVSGLDWILAPVSKNNFTPHRMTLPSPSCMCKKTRWVPRCPQFCLSLSLLCSLSLVFQKNISSGCRCYCHAWLMDVAYSVNLLIQTEKFSV